MEFPCHLYRCPGSMRRGEIAFDMAGAENQAQYDVLAENGWKLTFEEAVAAAGDNAILKRKRAKFRKPYGYKKPRKPSRPINMVDSKQAAVADLEAVADEQPTRDELVQKATDLGLKFDGRTGDKKLLAMIEQAIKEQPASAD